MPDRDALIADIRQHGFAIYNGRVISSLSDVPSSGSVSSEESNNIRGLYNLGGLQRLKDGLMEIGVDRAGNGLGGMDTVFWCDSYPVYNGYSVRSDTAVAIFRNLFQDNFNPPMRADGSRYGGAGVVPVFGGSTGVWTTNDPKDGSLISDAAASYDGAAPTWVDSNWQFYRHPNDGTNNRRIRWDFDGTSANTLAIRNRDKVTDAVPLIRQFLNDGTMQLNINTGALGFVTADGSAGTIAASNATTVQGKMWPRPAGWTGLDRDEKYSFQIASPASGSTFNDVFALAAFCDDWDKGARVHNICNPGSRMALWFSGQSLNTYGTSVIDNFTSSAPGSAAGGATRAKLYVMDDILNSETADNGTTETVFTWQSQLFTVMDRLRARPSRPCVLYLIPPPGNNATRIAKHPSYIRALKEVMYANADMMTVWDIGENLGGGVDGANCGNVYSHAYTDRGISNDDGTHLSKIGQVWLGQRIFDIVRY